MKSPEDRKAKRSRDRALSWNLVLLIVLALLALIAVGSCQGDFTEIQMNGSTL